MQGAGVRGVYQSEEGTVSYLSLHMGCLPVVKCFGDGCLVGQHADSPYQADASVVRHRWGAEVTASLYWAIIATQSAHTHPSIQPSVCVLSQNQVSH